MEKKNKALSLFRDNFNCSQAVLTSFAGDFGIDEDLALRIATPFGGGMGRRQKVCGAVTGALMVLGLKYGKGITDPDDKKKFTYEMTRKFIDEFTALNGSVVCKDLLNGLDMNDQADLQKINELNLFEVNCEKYVADAVNILENLCD